MLERYTPRLIIGRNNSILPHFYFNYSLKALVLLALRRVETISKVLIMVEECFSIGYYIKGYYLPYGHFFVMLLLKNSVKCLYD